MLERLQPANSQTEHLFIGTDRYKYFTVSWDHQANRLRTEQTYRDQADKTLRDSQSQDKCLIDPSRRFMALQLYDGIVTIIPVEQSQSKKRSTSIPGLLGEPVSVRISELFIRSLAWVRSGNEHAQIAILYEDNHQKTRLMIRALEYTPGGHGDSGSADLEQEVETHEDLEVGASHLIPVSAPACKYRYLNRRFSLSKHAHVSQTVFLCLPRLRLRTMGQIANRMLSTQSR